MSNIYSSLAEMLISAEYVIIWARSQHCTGEEPPQLIFPTETCFDSGYYWYEQRETFKGSLKVQYTRCQERFIIVAVNLLYKFQKSILCRKHKPKIASCTTDNAEFPLRDSFSGQKETVS